MQNQTFITVLLSCAGMWSLVAAEETIGADSLEQWMNRSNAVYSPHEAALVGSVEQLQVAVVAEPAQVNMPDEHGDMPLHIAAQRGEPALVQTLVQAGADVLAKDAKGRVALQLTEDAAVQEILLATRARREQELQLCRDVANGNVNKVKNALAQGVNPNALNEDNTQSVLCVAVRGESVEILDALLESGADVAYVTPNNKSILHVAALTAGEEVIQALLAAGADPMHPGNNGATPLHDAVWCGNVAAVRALLPAYQTVGFSPDGKYNGFPVTMAVSQGKVVCVQLFIEAGVDVNDVRFADSPLLHLAAKADNPAVVRLLLEAGANKQARDKEGKTAADYAKGKVAELLK